MSHSRVKISYGLIFLFIDGALLSDRDQQLYLNWNNITSYPPHLQPNIFDSITYLVWDANLSPAANNLTQAHRFQRYFIPVRPQYNSTFYSETGEFSVIQPPIPYITDMSYIPYQMYSHSAMPLYLFGPVYSHFSPAQNSFETNIILAPPDTNINPSSQYRLDVQENISDVNRVFEIVTEAPDEIISVQNEVFLPNPNFAPLFTSSDLQQTNVLIDFRNDEENVHINTQTNNSIISDTYTPRNLSDSPEIDILSLNQEVISDETQNNIEYDNSRIILENKIKELLVSNKKYFATANNLDLLSFCINDNILKIFIAYSSNYVCEFSMTRFRNLNENYLADLMIIQSSYQNYLNNNKIAIDSGNYQHSEFKFLKLF